MQRRRRSARSGDRKEQVARYVANGTGDWAPKTVMLLRRRERLLFAGNIQEIGIIIDFIFPRCYKVIVCKIS